MQTKSSAIILMVLCTGLTSFAQIFYKKGSATLQPDLISIITNYPLITGLFLYGIGAIMMIYAFQRGEVTVLYPIVALSYIWVSLLASHFFGEQMNILKWIGIIFIVAGIIAISFGGKKDESLEYIGAVE
jgi:drug/metabolite transporter (DMT)-like permease